jgi:hypothetical protein
VDPVKPIYVAIPTRDGQVLIHTVFELFFLGKMLGRPLRFLIGEAGNIPRSRNLVMEYARTLAEPATMAWLLWIDSDILIPSGMQVPWNRVPPTEHLQLAISPPQGVHTGLAIALTAQNPATCGHCPDRIAERQGLPDRPDRLLGGDETLQDGDVGGRERPRRRLIRITRIC